MKSISVVIFTYNQAHLIGRTLDSIFSQREWGLKQVVVADDCSTDNTSDILNQYKMRYPDIIDVFRNDVNLGIYPNVIKALTKKKDSDLFFATAGDDPICDGYFEGLQKYIKSNNIDTDGAIGIYSDWKEVRPDGTEKVFNQSIVTSGISLISLFMRLKIYNRSLVVSQKVFDAYDPIILDQGLRLAEMMCDIRSPRFIKNVYYMPQVTTTYYTDIGISTRLSIGKSDYFTKESTIQWKYFKNHFAETSQDKFYCDFQLMNASFLENPTWNKYILMLYYYVRSLIPGCGDTFRKISGIFYRLAKYKILYKH